MSETDAWKYADEQARALMHEFKDFKFDEELCVSSLTSVLAHLMRHADEAQ